MSENDDLLDGSDVGGLQAFGTLLDRKLNFLILLQAFVSFHFDGGKMDEYILATFAADKAKALGGIEPFDGTDETFF